MFHTAVYIAAICSSQAVGAVSGLASGLTEHLVPTATTATASSLGSGARLSNLFVAQAVKRFS